MSEFEFAIERELREWRLAFDLVNDDTVAGTVDVVPVLYVKMTPYPGEGIFRKIENIVQTIDTKISITRSKK
ncbi:MAG: hypothetical protein LBC74_10605 [Planctomycetaceae bacterium]|jgi:hypothetical protein|nr:hypothetical protein [Planctomycetaceae bacterium]